MKTYPYSLDDAYSSAAKFAADHYENFPVVSFLIPKNLRKHVAIIYWFARTADDYADEGQFSQSERLDKLNRFQNRFNLLLRGEFETAFEYALSETIKEKKLTPDYFLNLLKAFRQDVLKNRYLNFKEVEDYCGSSANPIGRLILELFDIRDEKAIYYSDKICTALQITNFYQDISLDYKKGRIYIPLDELDKFGVDEKIFELKENNLNFKLLMKFQVERAKSFFEDGKKLLEILDGRLKREIKWTILGGEAILKKIVSINYDILNYRPSLTKSDFTFLLLKSTLR